MSKLPEQIVNYVWINSKKFCPDHNDPESPLCGVPLHYIDRALDNAKRYHDANFNIWIDWRFLDDISRFLLESHIYINGASNVRLRNLLEIDLYRDESKFTSDTDLNIWARVDYARLLVLDHTLREKSEVQAFYADFDTKNIQILSKKCQSTLLANKIVLGSTLDSPYENGFIGVGKESKGLLSQLIAATRQEFLENKHGFTALKNTLKRLFDASVINQLGVVELPPCKIKMRKPKKYAAVC